MLVSFRRCGQASMNALFAMEAKLNIASFLIVYKPMLLSSFAAFIALIMLPCG